MRDYSGLEPRTRLFCMLVDGLGRRPPVEDMTLQQIQEGRGEVLSSRGPLGRLLGSVPRSVGITFGTASARDGYEIPLRLYRPRDVRDAQAKVPVVVFFHGGGWVQGNPPSYDPLCAFLAEAVRAVVVSVDYRLAPEHQAPTAAYDAVDATRWVAAHGAALRADPARLAVCGDSAGGNLAAVVTQQLRGELPIAHQALLYPASDLTLASPSLQEHADAAILSLAGVHAFRAHYLRGLGDAGEPFSDTDPLVSPLLAGDLTGLPPALIQTADLDPIRDDGIRYGAALRAAGVEVTLTNYRRVPHGFASFPFATSIGHQHRAELVDELRRHLWP